MTNEDKSKSTNKWWNEVGVSDSYSIIDDDYTPDRGELSFGNAFNEFEAVCRSIGLAPDKIKATNKIERCRVDGKKSDNKSGAYIFEINPDGFGYGWAKNWTTGEDRNFHSNIDANYYTDKERADFRALREAQKERAEAELEELHKAAADKAKEKWNASRPCESHPYLTAKGVQPHGAKMLATGELIIPIEIPEKGMTSYQTIAGNGSKRYCTGGEKKGGSYTIKGTTDVIAVVEGFATGASVHEATGWTTVVAFDTSGLKPVVEAVRKYVPKSAIVVAGDNDKSGAGKRFGDAAIAGIGNARAVYPVQVDWDFNDLHKAKGLNAVARKLGIIRERETKLVWIQDVKQSSVSWAIPGMIQEDGFTLMFGKYKSFKSFVAIDMACSIATGQDYHGKKVHTGPVVYISGEGNSGLKGRFEAWSKRHGHDLTGKVMFSTGAYHMRMPGTAEKLMTQIDEMLDGEEPRAIFIDTVKRNFGQGDENKPEDMQAFVDACDKIWQAYPQSAVIAVHHTGHENANRAMGSVNLPASADVIMSVEKKGKSIAQLTVEEAKEAPEGETLSFQVVEVGDSLVMESIDAIPTNTEADRMKKAFDTCGEFDAAMGVSAKALKHCYMELVGCNSGAADQAMSRQVKAGLLYKPQRGCYLLTEQTD